MGVTDTFQALASSFASPVSISIFTNATPSFAFALARSSKTGSITRQGGHVFGEVKQAHTALCDLSSELKEEVLVHSLRGPATVEEPELKEFETGGWEYDGPAA